MPIFNPASSGSGTIVHGVTGVIDFGFPTGNEGDTASVTVSAPWVTSNTPVFAYVAAESTPDHDPDDAVIEGIHAWVENIVVGVGFDIVASAPANGWGRYSVYAVGGLFVP